MAARVQTQSDAIVSGAPDNTTQQVAEDRGNESQDRKKEAYLPETFVQTMGFFKSGLPRKGWPIVSKAKWARDLYLRVVVRLTKGVRTVTWPISHLL